ncbi:interleukin 12 receptor, beta 2a, like isoform X2 [Centroberyx affinis]|uniref:interleukin 12 receptor, beta 2a, like isoform X2 n=1 Tax=Centroberyx affinis TaxID=166261 RepID=UPI003A5BE44E
MARPGTRWILSILLVNLPKCLASPGPPPTPSTPECHIPSEDHDIRIHCVSKTGLDHQTATTYKLHWESDGSNPHWSQMTGTSERVHGFIRRDQYYSHSGLHVWVQAENQHGSAKSVKISFNTGDIMRPPPPSVTHSSQEPFVIYWEPRCHLPGHSEGNAYTECEVRHRAEADQGWLEDEGGFGVYTLDSPQPYTYYQFQVRCFCADIFGLMSDWSAVYKVRSAEAAPVGELDVWRDCGLSSSSSECVLTWKTLPTFQARGRILGYEVKLFYSYGATALLNVSAAEPSGQLVCDEMRCHLNSSLKGVSAVSVSAYGAHGATSPARLAMPTPGKNNDEQAVHLKMDSESLNASWDLPSQLSDNLKEYVVQYKQAGRPPVQGFDWVRVHKSQATGTLKGQFENCTAYQVSLFTVSHNSSIHHLSSVIGYSLQGISSKVPSFKVITIEATHVTLFWKPVPLLQRKGVILCYQIGVDQKVKNVSASPQHDSMTFVLEHLSPGQEYEVWMRAVTEAGPGANTTTRFKTKDQEAFGYKLVLVLVAVIFCAFLISLALCACRVENNACLLLTLCCYEKVPDPSNSHIFRHMKHQFNDPLAWICVPVVEPHPKISQLEVVERQSQAFESSPENTSRPDGQLVGDECSQTDREGDQREDAVREEECERTEGRRRYGREEYSKMIDSDEERDREDSLSSSEEKEFTSGYEKHFMPTPMEILEV